MIVNFDEFSVRTSNCLKGEGIITYEQLFNMTDEELLSIPNFGRKCLSEVKHFIRNNNLDFAINDQNSGIPIKLKNPTGIGRRIRIENDETLRIRIEDSIFSRRTTNCLQDAKIQSIGNLLEFDEEYLLSLKSFGRTCLKEIFQVIPKLDQQISASKSIDEGLSGDINSFEVLRNLVVTICHKIKLPTKNIDQFCKAKRLKPAEKEEVINYIKIPERKIQEWNQKKINLFKFIVNEIDDRDFTIFTSRMIKGKDGFTLETLGNELGITRERVRQICKKIEKNLNNYLLRATVQQYMRKIVQHLKNNNGIMLINELLKQAISNDPLLNRENFETILGAYNYISKEKVSLININDEDYISTYDKKDIDSAYCDLLDEVDNLLGLNKNEIRDFLKLDETYNQEIEDICIDIFINKLGIFQKQKLIGIHNKTMLNLEFLLKEYPSGVHFSELIKKFSERFHDGEYQDRLRGYFERSENILLWGRGSYIHRDNVNVDLDKINHLYEKINNSINNLNNKTSVIHIFNENKALMNFMNIPNSYALYSILREQDDYQFVYRRFPDIEHISNAKEGRKKLFDEIDEYFVNMNRDLFWDELKSYFVDKRGLLPYQVTNTIGHSPNIYRIGTGRWIHKDHLCLDDATIKHTIREVESRLNGNDYLIFGKLIKDIELPELESFHWNRTLLSNLLRKHTDHRIIANIAVISDDLEGVKTAEDLVLNIVKTSNIKFSPASLANYLRRNKITTNGNFMYEFVNKYGYLLEK